MNIRVESAAQVHVEESPAVVQPEKVAPRSRAASPVEDLGALLDGPPSVGRTAVAKKPAVRPMAVFVAHGMGQQLSFSTLEATAHGMEQALQRRGIEADAISVSAKSLRLGDVRTPVVEMTVSVPEGEAPLPPVHLYEGYWASLTEGKVTLRDVMRFLVQAAWNGLRKGVGQPIERYMFGHTALHPVPWGSFVGLLGTALALASLVLLNAVIAGVVVEAGYGVLTGSGSAGAASATVLPQALTAVVVVYLAVTILFGVLVGSATLSAGPSYATGGPGAVRRFLLGALFVVFFGWALATMGTGLATLAILLFATDVPLPDRTLLATVGGIAVLFALGAGIASAAHGRKLMMGYRAHAAAHAGEDPLPDYDARPLAGGQLMTVTATLVVSVVVALGCVVALLAPLTPWLAEVLPLADSKAFRVVAWFLLFGVSGLIRNLLVQYFGDVAAYISPHTLDRFAELRSAIRDASVRVLRRIYLAVDKRGEPLYHGVAVVGHSLGSVVAYDSLNRVLSEDAAAVSDEKPGAGVGRRTRLLLTFGSPLDKTAYIFRAQNQSLSKVREALANAVQPLILDTAIRTFPWVNVHSTRDIIGSALDLYDMPITKAAQRDRARALRAECPAGRFDHEIDVAHKALDGAHCPYCVHDIDDPGARIPLVAHTEHWQTRAVFDVLVAAVFTPAAASAAATHEAAHAAEAA